MNPRSYGIRTASLVLAVSFANSCGADFACACSPPETPIGTYHATRLRFTPSGQATADALAAGATITITLSGGGATSGTLFVPASLNNGTQQTFDLAGTFQIASAHVTLFHSADTFLRDVGWTWQGSTLITTETAGGVQYDVVLTRP